LGALVSPGPDFLIVLRNALGYSARAGIYTAAGIAAGLLVHMAYCIAGIGLVISQSIVLFNIIKWVGAGYLVYVGIGALRSKGAGLQDMAMNDAAPVKSGRQAFFNGVVTNVFNPKATLFFLALFTQMIGPGTPFADQAILATAFVLTAFLWFSLVAAVMGIPRIRAGYARASKWIDRVFGAFFIALGAKLMLTRLD
ncbi:MAG TPA: LysE family transporter, partial [Alphaproteobacteria bacterium]